MNNYKQLQYCNRHLQIKAKPKIINKNKKLRVKYREVR